MSHCTSFPFAYTEERFIVSALRKMGLTFNYDVVSEYSSHISKLLSNFGYLGRKQYRSLVAEYKGCNLLIIRETDSFKFIVESAKGPVSYTTASLAEEEFRRAYIMSALESVCRDFQNKGIIAEIRDQGSSLDLCLGPDMSIIVNVSFANGIVTEDVRGCKGDICEEITAQIEAILAKPNTSLDCQWKTSHFESIDNKTIEVLRLG